MQTIDILFKIKSCSPFLSCGQVLSPFQPRPFPPSLPCPSFELIMTVSGLICCEDVQSCWVSLPSALPPSVARIICCLSTQQFMGSAAVHVCCTEIYRSQFSATVTSTSMKCIKENNKNRKKKTKRAKRCFCSHFVVLIILIVFGFSCLFWI